eukprot:1622376-Pleurochrysis_carterae.AAC.1
MTASRARKRARQYFVGAETATHGTVPPQKRAKKRPQKRNIAKKARATGHEGGSSESDQAADESG